MSPTFLEVRNLVKIFGKLTAVKDVLFKSGTGRSSHPAWTNPVDLEEVIWAISTRSNPEKDVDILRQPGMGRSIRDLARGQEAAGVFLFQAIIDAAGLSPGATSSSRCASRTRH